MMILGSIILFLIGLALFCNVFKMIRSGKYSSLDVFGGLQELHREDIPFDFWFTVLMKMALAALCIGVGVLLVWLR